MFEDIVIQFERILILFLGIFVNWFFSHVFVRPIFWVSYVISLLILLFLASLVFSLTLSEAPCNEESYMRHTVCNFSFSLKILLLDNVGLAYEIIIGKLKTKKVKRKNSVVCIF
jgi:hypothetical protein